jgi:hypothetical protein
VEQLLHRLQASVPTSQKCSCLKMRGLVFDSIFLLRLLAAERNVTLFVPREFKLTSLLPLLEFMQLFLM